MQAFSFIFAALLTAAPPDKTLEPWASNRHPQDVARRHVEDITAAKQDYRVKHGGTMDGTNCRSPIGGGFGIWDQSWESNRAVRLENVGDYRRDQPLAFQRPQRLPQPQGDRRRRRPARHERPGEGDRAVAAADHAPLPRQHRRQRSERPGQGLQRLRLHDLRQRFHLPGRPLAHGGLPGAPGPLPRALHLAGLLRRPLEPPGRRHGALLSPPRQPHDRRRAGPGARPRPAQAQPHRRHPRPRQPGRRRGVRRPVRLGKRMEGKPGQRPRTRP